MLMKIRFSVLSILLVAGLSVHTMAQIPALVVTPDDSTTEETEKETPKKKKPKEPEFQKLIEDYEMIEGLFTIFKNDSEGNVYLEIKPEQFGVVYLMNLTREAGDGTLFGGAAMLGYFPFYIEKIGKKVQIIEKNVLFRADDTGPMNRALQRNLSNSLFASAKITSRPHPERGSILVDAEEIFLADVANVEHKSGEAKVGYSFDKGNSYFSKIKSYPLNTELEVTLHFKSKKPHPIFTLADSKSMFHRYHFSISALPKTDYKPRIADDRLGHFLTMYQDYESVLEDSPYQRFINRWHLEKSEPKFDLSPPKQPIVFWLENTIPVEYRSAVSEGALLWNNAFEKIGFKDALVLKQMPDDADWDPADARYNTIRWMVEPGAGYAAGPSRANPFTGQIYDADIRVSADIIRFYYREFDEFVTPISWAEADISRFFPGIPSQQINDPGAFVYQCNFASGLRHQMAFGWNLLQARGKVSENDLQQFLHDAIVDLIVHEVGHTLGLRHNFKASTVYNLKELTNKSFTQKNGLTGSVMDYNPVNISPKGEPQGNYFHTTLGPYDYWAIEYAYKSFDPNSKTSEKALLDKIAEKVAKPEYQYGTDEDALGFTTRGIDPSCTYWDLGNDSFLFYKSRVEMARELWKDLPKYFEEDGERYTKFRLVFGQGLIEFALASMNISKFIGGIYNYRDHIGDPNGRIPFDVVTADKQREALDFLIDNVFSENAFQFSPDLLNKLAAERFWDFEGTVFRMSRIDYPIHGIVQLLQAIPLFRLYDPIVLQRINDNELRFKKGGNPFILPELFTAIQEAAWEELDKGVMINSFRRELQRMHLSILIQLVTKDQSIFPHDAISLARADLVTIKEKIKNRMVSGKLDAYTNAHLQEIDAKIKAALEAQANLEF
jgi:hypothetical protein